MKLSIICPAYNEADNLTPLYRNIKSMVDQEGYDYEIIIVNDGSTDKTAEVLKELQATDPKIKIFGFDTNQGQSRALMEGIKQSTGEILAFLDADLQNDPADIPILLEKLKEGNDLVCGWRRSRKDSYLTYSLPSKVANKIIRMIFKIKVHDIGCTLKVVYRDTIKNIQYFKNFHRYIPIILNTGIKISEVEVHHHPRRSGQSKYTTFKAFGVIKELVYLQSSKKKRKKNLD